MSVAVEQAKSWKERAVESLPPMLKQYVSYKEQHPDTLMLVQVGDFYEAFFDDAVLIAKTLNLTLTSRDKNSSDPIPMAGVPVAVVENYVARLTEQGISVGIISQTEPASQAKGMVARSLRRIITPGINVLSEQENLGTARPIGALIPMINEDKFKRDTFGCVLAYSVIEQGVVAIKELHSFSKLLDELQRLQLIELVIPTMLHGKALDRRKHWIRDLGQLFEDLVIKFRADNLGSEHRELSKIEGFSQLDPIFKRAVRLLLLYVDETTVDLELPVTKVTKSDLSNVMSIDMMTRRNLELVRNSKEGSIEGSLLSTINKTVTKAGFAKLRDALLNPLVDTNLIEQRHNCIACLIQRSFELENLQKHLRQTTDLQRIAMRIELGIVTPQELVRLRSSLEVLPEVQFTLSSLSETFTDRSELLESVTSALSTPTVLLNTLVDSLDDRAPAVITDGGIFLDSYDSELQEQRELARNGKQLILNLEAKYKEETGINSLKVKHNNVLGFFVEVTKVHAHKLSETFVKKQATTNAVRFVTTELKELEEKVQGAESAFKQREHELFIELRAGLPRYVDEIRSIGMALAELDMLVALALVAISGRWVRPTINTSSELEIIAGQHPVMQAVLKEEFVPNSLSLGADHPLALIVTGPNMGGKSTYLRQAALVVILAQMGSFVPAEAATIGVVDKIFARIGASDNLLEGESTFMVEMREASYILRQASQRSLVLIDEIGRGTATGDGLAIAQSILEFLLQAISCRTLFATHFHELAQLEQTYSQLGNCSVGVVEHESQVHFTHEIKAGAASKSYGLEVATLAGLPQAVLQRARELFNVNELLVSARDAESKPETQEQIGLFHQPVSEDSGLELKAELSMLRELQERIKGLDLNNITPIEALQMLVELQNKSNDSI